MTSPPLLYFSCGSTADRANLLLRRHQQHSVRLCVGSFAALRQAVGLRCLHQGRVQRFSLTGAHCRSDPDVLRSRPPAVVGLRSPLAYSWRLALVLIFWVKIKYFPFTETTILITSHSCKPFSFKFVPLSCYICK